MCLRGDLAISRLETPDEILTEQERPLDEADALDRLVGCAQIPGNRPHKPRYTDPRKVVAENRSNSSPTSRKRSHRGRMARIKRIIGRSSHKLINSRGELTIRYNRNCYF